jgi:hypothetical protein
MELEDYVGKTVHVKHNRSNCPKAGTCNIHSCDACSPVGYVGVVKYIDYDSKEEITFVLNNGNIRWICRCEIVGEVKKDCKDYPHTCPRCGAPAYQGLTIVDCTKCGKF